MKNRTVKRGASARFLALLASLTMIMAGVAGVALAGTASATDNKVWVCHADTNNGQGQIDLGVDGTGGESKNGFNLLNISQSAWENAHQALHPDDRLATSGEIEQGYCGPHDDPECTDDEELVDDVCAPKCEEGEIRNGDGKCVNPCDEDVVSIVTRGNVKEDPCDDPCDDTVNLNTPRTLEEKVECPSEPKATATLTCDGAWTVDISGYEDSDEAGVRVYVDEELVDQGYLDDGAYSDKGSTELSDSASHSIEVWINLDGYLRVFSDEINCDAPVEPTVSATCSTLTINVNDFNPEWFYIYQNDSQIDYAYDEESNTITADLDGSISKNVVVWYGDTEEPLWADTVGACENPPPPGFCTLNPGSVSCNPPATCANNPAACPPETPVTTPVVEAASVAAPAQAVAAPAPAKVSVPAKATLPAAVPAGDGSRAPGLPMWAIALMIVGLLGAGLSARSVIAARK